MRGRSCISKNASNYIRLTSTSGASHDADTNNSCRLLQPAFTSAVMEGEQPTAIIMSSSIPMFSRLETPGAQLSALQKCPGSALPGWQDHSGPQAAPSHQPQGLGSLLHTGRVPVSSVCLFVYVCLA